LGWFLWFHTFRYPYSMHRLHLKILYPVIIFVPLGKIQIMKKITCAAVLIILFISAHAQDKTIRLIVRGDDMGYTHSGNEALIKCYKEGIETSIEVIVASPWFPEAVKLLQQNPGVDVGIHLALTSEWDNIKWRPLSDCPSLKDSNGYFYPKAYPDKNYPGQSILENHCAMADIEKEFRAQIELALKKIPRISHISSHMGCTNITDDVKALTKKLAKEYHIDIDLEEYHVIWKGYDGPSKTAAEKIQSFISMLSKLEPGKTYWFLDHPGIDNEELQAVYHIGYGQVAADRQGVTDLFINEKVIAFIKQKGIRLISYRDLAHPEK
jgi:chitin disaccharide deacetylase